jgi:hypothetical protein
MRDAGPKHEDDGKFRRPPKSGRSINVDDRIFRHPHVSRHPWFF